LTLPPDSEIKKTDFQEGTGIDGQALSQDAAKATMSFTARTFLG
jgi:hypothetical protein